MLKLIRQILYDELENQVFSESTWQTVLSEARKAGRMNVKEFNLIKRTPVAKILAATAYFAGCQNPDQIAVLRIIDMIGGVRNKTFFRHRGNQSIRDRLLPGICFPGGNPTVIEVALTLCELISLNDHVHDQDVDRKKGIENPVNLKIVSFYTNKEVLIRKLNQNQKIFQKYQSLFKTDITYINSWVG